MHIYIYIYIHITRDRYGLTIVEYMTLHIEVYLCRLELYWYELA